MKKTEPFKTNNWKELATEILHEETQITTLKPRILE